MLYTLHTPTIPPVILSILMGVAWSRRGKFGVTPSLYEIN